MDEPELDQDVKDFMGVYDSRRKVNTNDSVNLPFDITFDKNAVPIFDGSVGYSKINTKEAPGALATAVGEFRDVSEFSTASRFLDDVKYKNPFYETAPEGWSVKDEIERVTGLDPKYFGPMMKAKGPQEFSMLYGKALDRQADDNDWKDGSTFMKLVGGFAASVTNPSSLFPIARAAKYISMSEGLLMNVARMTPGIAASSIAHNAWQNSLKQGGNMEDFIVDTAVDTIAGLAFMGGGAGLSEAINATHLWNVRGTMKMLYDGIETKAVINKEGEVVGHLAVPLPGEAMSAQKVSHAQKFLDSEMAKQGLFKVPYLSGLLGKGASAINPIVRGLTSEWETLRGWTNSVYSHSLVTQGIEKGEEAPIKFEEIMSTLRGENQQINYQYSGFYLERIGIEQGNQGVNFVQKMLAKSKDQYVTEEAFGAEVQGVMTSGTPSQHAPVNAAAAMVREELDKMYSEYRFLHDKEENWLPSKTAFSYLSRVYNRDFLLNNQGLWEQTVFNEIKRREAIIDTHMQPIEAKRQEIKDAKIAHDALIKSNPEDSVLADSVRALSKKQRELKRLKDNVQNMLRDTPDMRIHIEDANAVSAREANMIKKIMKPIKKMEEDHSAKKAELEAINKEVFTNENRKYTALQAEKALERDAKVKELKIEQDRLKSEIREIKEKIADAHDNIQVMAQEGKLNRNIYNRIPGSNEIKLKDPKIRLKFVDKFESDHAIIESAGATRNTILNQTNEETLNQVMNNLNMVKGENPVKNRTLMIPDEALYNAGFLNRNIAHNVSNYRVALGRMNSMKKVFGNLSDEGGIKPLTDKLTLEYQTKVAKNQAVQYNKDGTVKSISPKEKRDMDRETRRLQKSFDSAKEDMANGLNRMMGRNRLSKGQRAFSNISRTFAAMTKLGFLPLTMQTDMAAIMFKHGFWPSIRDGLLPVIKTLNGYAKTKAGESMREDAAHAHLANNHLMSGYNEREWNSMTEQHVPILGKLQNGLETAAHVTTNFNLTSYFENFLQRWTASVVQSKIMKFMLDHEAGNLSKANRKTLLLYGINPDEWGPKFLKGWRKAGEDGNGFGGYQSNYWRWDDATAVNRMSQSIQNAVKDTIIRRGMGDAPFFTDNNLLGMMYGTFKGWTMASGTRYLMPLMQQPDPQKIMGTVLMLGAGAMQEPLYRFAKGETEMEPNNENKWIFQSITNSGVFSLPAEFVQEANIIAQGRLFPGITNERFKNRSLSGVLFGPQGGIADDLSKIMTMAISGNYNENDVKKMARMTPVVSSIYLRGLTNKWIESMGMPKTYNEAKGE